MQLVLESVVVQRDTKLVALVHPDMDAANDLGIRPDALAHLMEQNRTQVNEQLAAYCKLAEIEIHKNEFEKTPKKSIKRYLYK